MLTDSEKTCFIDDYGSGPYKGAQTKVYAEVNIPTFMCKKWEIISLHLCIKILFQKKRCLAPLRCYVRDVFPPIKYQSIHVLRNNNNN